MTYYILKGKTPIPCASIRTWAKWFNEADRHVEKTRLKVFRDGKTETVLVSTVFLGIDHSFGFGEPILFETMIFGGEYDEYQDRYHTWDGAVSGHEKAVERVKKGHKAKVIPFSKTR